MAVYNDLTLDICQSGSAKHFLCIYNAVKDEEQLLIKL